MATKSPDRQLAAHFAKSSPAVRATFDVILKASQALGDVTVQPKKTSIHLVRASAFAGVATRSDSLILTLKSATAIKGPRVLRAQQTSANRWHVEFKLTSPRDVDAAIRRLLTKAYDLAS